MASVMITGRAAKVGHRLDRTHEEQDNRQHSQQPMRRHYSLLRRASCVSRQRRSAGSPERTKQLDSHDQSFYPGGR
jgi:hypothetical protein